jgi:peroxiredoxin
MEASYQKYRQDVEIVALSPYDAPEDIVAFQQEHSLSFPMAACSRDLTIAFGIGSYPTSVVIDRDGRICLIHTGAITQSQVLDKLFETFTAEDYAPRVYNSINELL